MSKPRVRLINVQGDQEEFADLIGTNGRLTTDGPYLCFLPSGRGDWLTMPGGEQDENESTIVIRTPIGNQFTFRKLL